MGQGNFRLLLLEELTERKRRNPAYSLSAFSRSLGISAPSLSQILSGKRPLSRKAAAKILDRCLFTPARRQQFLESAFDVGEGTEIHRQEDVYQSMELDRFTLLADWYHFAILCLGDLPGNRWSAEWIASQLDIATSEARDAMARLKRLGLVTRKGRGFLQTTPPLSVATQPKAAALKLHHQQNLRKAEAALESATVPLELFSSMTMAVNEENLPAARELIKNFRRGMCQLLESGPRRRVYTLAVQLIPISNGGQP